MAQPVLVNEAVRPGVVAALRDLWAHRELVVELSKRSLMLRYKNSVLGVVWSLATPIMSIFVITVMTKLFLGQQIPNYSAYLFAVMFPWQFFSAGIPDMCIALLENAPLIRKVYFPRELLPITVMLTGLVHLVIALALALLYLVALRIFPWQVNWQILLLVLIVPAQCCLVLGLGLVVSVLNVLYEDVRFLVTVGMQLLLYLVPIIYPIERVAKAAENGGINLPLIGGWVGDHLLQLYLLNPFASTLVLYQKAMLPAIRNAGYDALPFDWGLLAQTWVVSLAALAFGLWYFDRLKWEAVERL